MTTSYASLLSWAYGFKLSGISACETSPAYMVGSHSSPTAQGRLIQREVDYLRNLPGDESGYFLKLLEHLRKYEGGQADSADSITFVLIQTVSTVTSEVMAKVKGALRDKNAVPTSAVAALAARSKAPAHSLPQATTKAALSTSAALVRTAYVLAGAGRNTTAVKLSSLMGR